MPYAPQAIAIATARGLGGGAVAMLYAGRLAGLAVSLAIVFLAIRRTPRGGWVFCVVALLPAALFEAGASVSHDVFNLAVVLFVVSSALRMLDPDRRPSMRAMLVEASVLSVVLAFCKPTYATVALCYLLPALGDRRQRDLRLLAIPVGVALVISVLWNNAVDHLWATDADVFGVAVDEDRQQDALLDAPWDFLIAVVRTTFEEAGNWLRDLLGSNPRYVDWWRPLQLLGLAAFGLVAIAPRDLDRRPLRSCQRALLAGIFVVGSLLVFAAYWVFWTSPGDDVIGGLQIRYFLPLLPLLVLALVPPELGFRVWRALCVPPGLVVAGVERAVVLTAVGSVV